MDLLPSGGIGRLSFDVSLYPLREAVCAALGRADLERLEWTAPRTRHHQALQSSRWHQLFYGHFEQHVAAIYLDLVRHLRDRHGIPAGGLVYQRVPTLRVHPPGGVAVGEWHTDSEYGHVPGEANFWLPLTAAFGTNTLWITLEGHRGPQSASYGEIIVFDGVHLLHGNVCNDTRVTRVSLDFRLADARTFRPSGQTSASAGRRLALGDYFAVI